MTIADLHAKMGYDYRLPDLSSPLVVAREEIAKNGRLQGAAILRLQAEAYLWVDPDLSVASRFRVMLELHRRLIRTALGLGIDCAVAYLPPNISPSFRRLLSRLGWSRDRAGWESWSREIL